MSNGNNNKENCSYLSRVSQSVTPSSSGEKKKSIATDYLALISTSGIL